MRERKNRLLCMLGECVVAADVLVSKVVKQKRFLKKVHQSESKADLHQFFMLMMKYNEADIRDGK